jgi:hypothetical protein
MQGKTKEVRIKSKTNRRVTGDWAVGVHIFTEDMYI